MACGLLLACLVPRTAAHQEHWMQVLSWLSKGTLPCSHGYQFCGCTLGLVLQWNSTAPGSRAKCVLAPHMVNVKLVVPVTLCLALALGCLAYVAWLWLKTNAERLAKAAGPPGGSLALLLLLQDPYRTSCGGDLDAVPQPVEGSC